MEPNPYENMTDEEIAALMATLAKPTPLTRNQHQDPVLGNPTLRIFKPSDWSGPSENAASFQMDFGDIPAPATYNGDMKNDNNNTSQYPSYRLPITVNISIKEMDGSYNSLNTVYGADSHKLLDILNEIFGFENNNTTAKIYLLNILNEIFRSGEKKTFTKIKLLEKVLTQYSFNYLITKIKNWNSHTITITKKKSGDSYEFYIDPLPSSGGSKKRRRNKRKTSKRRTQYKRRRA
jgi:hypothetical protein